MSDNKNLEGNANLSEKEERKARAKEEYRQRALMQEQQVLAERAKDAEREAKNEQLIKEGKEVKYEKRSSNKQPNILVRFWHKVKDVFGEAKHVSWAKPDRVFRSTVVVLAVTCVFLIVATLMDVGLGYVYEWFIGNV